MRPEDYQGKSGTSIIIKAAFALTGIIAGFIIIRAFITPFTVSDNSMTPGLKKGKLIFIFKAGEFNVGDIVLFRSPLEPGRVLLKRIIAKEGDIIEVRNKVFYKNSIKMKFPWKTVSIDGRILPMNFTTRDNCPVMRIRRKQYFVMGDNLDYSLDSRVFGPVDAENIIGEMIFEL